MEKRRVFLGGPWAGTKGTFTPESAHYWTVEVPGGERVTYEAKTVALFGKVTTVMVPLTSTHEEADRLCADYFLSEYGKAALS